MQLAALASSLLCSQRKQNRARGEICTITSRKGRGEKRGRDRDGAYPKACCTMFTVSLCLEWSMRVESAKHQR